ncbi:ABC transporter permease [Clostridium sp. KNHs205]|uniref:ABC transporter permease n=1 Tax=Clostridium sp. KNHs205 TaxID=1449050 RepID=UPI00051C8AD1|nr:ABC transporter permease [Clostridium sp. KNHs205]
MIRRFILKNYKILFRLAINDFKAKYSGSFLGIMWAFIQPLITILVFWFVFQMGFKTTPINNFPYILWFISAYIPWIFFTDVITATANCFNEYSYLVKKVKFNIVLLPLIKVISALIIHIFFIFFIFVMFGLYGFRISIYNFQAFYYTGVLVIYALGLAFILSSLAVFFKDLIQLINIILQIGFWITPIFWSIDGIDKKVLNLVKINPMYYIVSGYRDSFIYHISVVNKPVETIYFIVISIVLLLCGIILLKKLRPHFADVL